MHFRRMITAAVTASAIALFAGCSNSEEPSDQADQTTTQPAPSTETSTDQAGHNEADVTFVNSMIVHHEQAIEMAELVDGRTASPEIIDLAERIRAAQGPEIEQMRGWLAGWGVEESTPSEHGGHSMPGMMTEEQLAELGNATGLDFDRLFLELMIAHHAGAIEQSETVLADGANSQVEALAKAIIDAQQAEIIEMEGLLPQG